MARKKSLGKKISRKKLNEKEMDAAAEEMHRGSDRVCAILGAALVENSLEEPLKHGLEEPKLISALFYAEGAPFGTFHKKTIVSQALGLIDQRTADDLDRIRAIRNQFAHALLSIDFEHEDIGKIAKELSNYVDSEDLEPVDNHPDEDKHSARERFEAACWAISTRLEKTATGILQEKIQKLQAEAAALQAVVEKGRGVASRPTNVNALLALLGHTQAPEEPTD